MTPTMSVGKVIVKFRSIVPVAGEDPGRSLWIR